MQHFFKRRAIGLEGRERTSGFEFEFDALRSKGGALLVDQSRDHIRRVHLMLRTGGGLQLAQKIRDAGGLTHHMGMKLAPEGGLPQAVEVKVLLTEPARSEIQEGMHRTQRLVQVQVQPGSDDPQAQDPVGDEQVLQHRELFLQQSIALHLEDVELHGAVQGLEM